MPQVPYSPIPTVSPSTQQPRDYIDTQASPLDFGAQVGGAEQKLGGEVGQAGNMLAQHALAFQQLDNETMARDAGMKLAQGMGDAWANYRQLEGKAAYDGYGDFVNGLQKARQDAIDSLPNPEAREMLAQQSAYLVDRWQMTGGGYAADQRKAWMIQSHQANQSTAVNQATLFRNDPQSVMAWANTFADSVHQEGQLRHWDDATIAANIAAGKGALYRTVIGTLAAEDPAAAAKLFDQVKGQLDGQSVELITRELKTKIDDGVANAWVNANLGGATTPVGLPEAIHGQEGSGDRSVSTAGARGQWQITPATFKQYAKPGENIDNPRDNDAVGHRIINDLSQRFNGDPARVAVGYFSGPDNVAPPGSKTPWISDKKDTNGVSTSSYVSGVLSRLAGSKSGSQVAFGDSLAVGLRTAGKMPGTAQVGASPSAVLDSINAADPATINGKDVILSGGASNDPSKVDLVAEQVRALQDKGARSVSIIGVGDSPKLAGVNDALRSIADRTGATFQPLDPATLSPDHVHPSDYTSLLHNVAATRTFGGQPGTPGSAPAYPDESALVQKAIHDFPDPDQQARVLSKLTRQLTTIRLATETDRTDLEKSIPDIEAGLLDGRDFQIPEDRIRRVMPPAQAAATLENLDVAQKAGRILSSVQWGTPQDVANARADLAGGMGPISALVRATVGKGKVPGQESPGTEDQETPEAYRLRTMILKRFNDVLAARDAALSSDPAGYVQNEPSVVAARNEYEQAQDDQTKATALQHVISATQAVQTHLGVPEAQQHILPATQAQSIVKNLTSIDPAKGDMGGALAGVAQQYGAAWPKAFGDLVTLGKLSPDYQVLAAMPDPASRTDFQRALAASSEKGGAAKLREDVPPQAAKDIDAGLDDAINDFRRTAAIPGLNSNVNLIATVRDSIKTLSYFYAMQSGNGQDALQRATDAVLNNKYDFSGTMRVPKGMLGAVETATGNLVDGLQAKDLLPLAADTQATAKGPGMTVEQRQAVTLNAAKQGQWIPNESDSGLLLVARLANGAMIPIRHMDGSRVELSFANVGKAAQSAQPDQPFPQWQQMPPQ